MSTEYSTIRVATLRGDIKIPFNAYVYVAGKHILYCRSGDTFVGERLNRLRAKKLRKMFILKDDEIAYQQYLEQSIVSAYSNNDKKPMEIRIEVIQGFQQGASESYYENPADEFTYKHLRSSAQRFTEFLENEPTALRHLLEIPNSDQSISHHCVNVAAIAVSLAIELDLREGMPLHLLALGCLLHDMEHYFSEQDIFKPIASFNPEELTRYKAHPLAGAHRLQGIPFLDQTVHSIITQHEEVMDGTGFPKKLREDEMDPLVLVASLANAYDRLVSIEGIAHKDALKNFLIGKMGQYPLGHMQTLQAILKRVQIV